METITANGITYDATCCPVCERQVCIDPTLGTLMVHGPGLNRLGHAAGKCLGSGLNPDDPDPRTA